MSELAEEVQRLKRTLALVEDDLRAMIARMPAEMDPAIMRDANGRYILLDAQVCLVNALAAIER